MSGGCKVYGYSGDELDARHIEHAHKVALVGARLLAEQGERYKRTIAVLSGQRKNAMIMGVTQENARLRGELARAIRMLEERTERLRDKVLGTGDHT